MRDGEQTSYKMQEVRKSLLGICDAQSDPAAARNRLARCLLGARSSEPANQPSNQCLASRETANGGLSRGTGGKGDGGTQGWARGYPANSRREIFGAHNAKERADDG